MTEHEPLTQDDEVRTTRSGWHGTEKASAVSERFAQNDAAGYRNQLLGGQQVAEAHKQALQQNGWSGMDGWLGKQLAIADRSYKHHAPGMSSNVRIGQMNTLFSLSELVLRSIKKFKFFNWGSDEEILEVMACAEMEYRAFLSIAMYPAIRRCDDQAFNDMSEESGEKN